MITITKAPAYLTIQDEGRKSSRSIGVPRGGAMDSFALAAANIVCGNDPGAAALEWALTGGVITFGRDTSFTLAGAQVQATLSDAPVPPLTKVNARARDTLSIEAFSSGRFLYLAFAGGIDVPDVLGSKATYLPAGLGGTNGGMLKSGNQVQLGAENIHQSDFRCPPELAPNYASQEIRITRGPQASLFGSESWRALLENEFRISLSSDRTGYRLEGRKVAHELGLLPSEPGCSGAIQVPTDGSPIVLMADAPTVGGYPKIAVVAEADLPVLAQKTPGNHVQFNLVSIEESQRAIRRRLSDLDLLGRRRAGTASK